MENIFHGDRKNFYKFSVSIIKEMKFAMKEVRHEREKNGKNKNGRTGGTYYGYVPPNDGPSHPLVP